MTRAVLPAPNRGTDESIADLLKHVGDNARRLLRAEVALARAEVADKVRAAGMGAALLGAAVAIALFGVAVLVAAAVLGLSTVLAPWLAALAVGGALVLIALAAALIGARRIRRAQPIVPRQMIASLRDDVAAIREAVQR